MKVRDLMKKCMDMIEEGKADWDLIIENKKDVEVVGFKVVAVKPEGMECLFG